VADAGYVWENYRWPIIERRKLCGNYELFIKQGNLCTEFCPESSLYASCVNRRDSLSFSAYRANILVLFVPDPVCMFKSWVQRIMYSNALGICSRAWGGGGKKKEKENRERKYVSKSWEYYMSDVKKFLGPSWFSDEFRFSSKPNLKILCISLACIISSILAMELQFYRYVLHNLYLLYLSFDDRVLSLAENGKEEKREKYMYTCVQIARLYQIYI